MNLDVADCDDPPLSPPLPLFLPLTERMKKTLPKTKRVMAEKAGEAVAEEEEEGVAEEARWRGLDCPGEKEGDDVCEDGRRCGDPARKGEAGL